MHGASRGLATCLLTAGLLLPFPAPHAAFASTAAHATSSNSSEDEAIPIAGAFIYPVGDELDYTKPRSGEPVGYHLSDPYQSHRGSKERVHLGVDLSNGRGGSVVRSVASGVVMVTDPDARIPVRTKTIVKKRVLVHGKRVTRRITRWHTTYHWRTGWGNYVFIHHVLPSGESVYSLYAHLAPGSVIVKRGQIVAAGDPVARVGSTGRATSPHLHLEIRKSVPHDRPDGGELLVEREDQPTAEERSFALLETVNPIDFLQDHVRNFDDLEPGTWQARYALAACRDGITSADGDRFHPEAPVSRIDFYHALVCAFRLSSPFPVRDWGASVSALIDAGILDRAAASDQQPGDKMTRSEALEILLRCLDRHRACARNLGELDAMEVSRDFNRQFAGETAAREAERQAVARAAAETRARAKAEARRVARARQNARASSKKHPVKARPVRPASPVPILDAGFQSAALSKQELTRAESCLLLATATRPGSERYSALQRAADRVAQSQ